MTKTKTTTRKQHAHLQRIRRKATKLGLKVHAHVEPLRVMILQAEDQGHWSVAWPAPTKAKLGRIGSGRDAEAWLDARLAVCAPSGDRE